MEFETAGVIVTYNRKELLLNNLNRLLSQNSSLSKIIIIDNASTDGTYKYLQENEIIKLKMIEFISLEENSGGAGGFYEGVKRGYEEGYDFLWLMDDDGAPYNNDTFGIIIDKAINLKQQGNNLLVLNSLVVCDDATLSFGLVGSRGSSGFIETKCDAFKKACNGLLNNTLNPFNGTLFTRELIDIVGFPNKDFFIKGDDFEYCLRCKAAEAIIATVVNSVYYHPPLPMDKCKLFGKERTISNEVPWKQYYKIRNYTKIYSDRKKYKAIYKLMLEGLMAVFISKEKKYRKLKMLFKGLIDGLFGKMGKRVSP